MIRLNWIVAMATCAACGAWWTPAVAMDAPRRTTADLQVRQLEQQLRDLEKGWRRIALADDLPPAPLGPTPQLDDAFRKHLEPLSQSERAAALLRLFDSMRSWADASATRSRAMQRRHRDYRRKHRELRKRIDDARKQRDQQGRLPLII